jgi:hypothetical protein
MLAAHDQVMHLLKVLRILSARLVVRGGYRVARPRT